MAFLDKLSGMAKNIGDKASGAVETTKLNSKISAEKNAIDGVYKKLGECYYQRYKSGESLPEEAAAFCTEIDGHNTAIDEAKAEIERIKAEVAAAAAVRSEAASAPADSGIACPSCGTQNEPGKKFCAECGAKLEAAPAPAPASAPVDDGACPSCGTQNGPGKKFCAECGAKL